MKKMSLTLIILTIIFQTVILFNSCKKGEEDPIVSFRSRDNRLVGKWKMTIMESTKIEEKYFKFSNNINTEYTLITGNLSITQIYDGTNMTTNYNNIYDTTDVDVAFNELNSVFESTSYKSIVTLSENMISVVTFEVTLNEDYTYEIITTMTNGTGSNSYKRVFNNTTVQSTSDTTYTYANFFTTSEQGYWYWGIYDADNDLVIRDSKEYVAFASTCASSTYSKILNGKLTRLAEKEMVIESILIYNKSFTNNTNYSKNNFNTNNDITNPLKTKEGLSTTEENKLETYFSKVTLEKLKN